MSQGCHFSHNIFRISKFLFFSYFFCHFSYFLIKKINFWFLLRPLTFSRKIIIQSQHSNLFSNNLDAFKVYNNNNNIQWKNIVKACSEILFSKNSYHIETSQMISKTLQLTGFYMIRVFSGQCFQTNFKIVFVFSSLMRTHDLTWQYINPGLSMNVLCTFNLFSVFLE